MESVADWLRGLGLEEHIEAFVENRIDARSAPELTNDDLRELGIPLGHRKILLKAIAELLGAGDGTAPRPDLNHLATPSHVAEAERRQLTVVFCDLVGSTRLAAGIDPEDYRETLSEYRAAATAAIRRYEGHTASFMGDGILAYFGYPMAHEDDPERAARAALGIVDAVAALARPGRLKLQVRIGMATGLVVAGDVVVEGATEERAVLGDAPNLAARLQSLARPDEVVLSEATKRLVEGRIETVPLGPRVIKGFDYPVHAYRAVAVIDASRFDSVAARGLTPMAGRGSELALLSQRWDQAGYGDGQVVLLSGEPGIGKSRLTAEFRRRIGGSDAAALGFHCSPYHGRSAFHPFIVGLGRDAGFRTGDSDQTRREKLAAFAVPVLGEDPASLSLLASLLAIDEEGGAAEAMTPLKRKAETIAVLLRLILEPARDRPALLIFEDVHWIDPSSQEVLDLIVARARDLRMLCIVTCRPEYQPPWPAAGHATTLSLNRLGRREVGEIATKVAGTAALPPEVLARIVDRTDGVPLFVEELTKTVLESGLLKESGDGFALDRLPPSFEIPASLRDSLLARLDRLASVRAVAQTAACIGREFTLNLLEAASASDRLELEAALDRLVEAGLVFRQGSGAAAGFQFKHALVQDAAYQSLLRRERRQLHARIAEAMLARYPGGEADGPERIAQHYSAAAMSAQALPFWLAAGRAALERSNLTEAIGHLTQALELTGAVDDTAVRAETELEVRTALGAAIMAAYGWPAPQVPEVIRPACDLCEKGYGTAESFMNLFHLCVHHGCRAEHREGLAVVERMLAFSAARDDAVLSLVSAFTASMAHLWVGNCTESERQEAAALELYDFERDRLLAAQHNHDPKNTLLSWGALRTWLRGDAARAREMTMEAVTHARSVEQPFNLCWTLGNTALVHMRNGDFDAVHAQIEEMIAVSRAQGLGFMEIYMAPAVMCQCDARTGDFDTAFDKGMKAEEIWRSVGGRFLSPTIKATMARSALELGRFEEASRLATAAVRDMEETGELMLGAEIYCTAGLVARRGDDDSAAESMFDKSLQAARAQGARSFELQTTLAIARNLKRAAAADLLSPVLAAMPTGLCTPDMLEARALLGSRDQRGDFAASD